MPPPQHCLDPSLAASTAPPDKIWHPDHPIPQRIRAWGYSLDLDLCLPGDLLMISAQAPGVVAMAIRRTQERGGYDRQHARWEHVAVYIGSGMLCEASRGGVRISSIYNYLPGYLLRMRRNRQLDATQRWVLVINALTQRGYAYGYLSAGELLFNSWSGYWLDRRASPRLNKRGLICSELYGNAHVKTCGIKLGNRAFGETTPASLSMEVMLDDVAIAWVQIGG